MATSSEDGASTSESMQVEEPRRSKKRKLDASQVSDRDITDIANKLGSDDLQKLFHALDLASNDIEKAEIKAGTLDVSLKAKRVLETWRQSNGLQATQDKVLCALEEYGNRNAREELEHKWTLKGQSDHQFDFATCKQELITYYTQVMGNVELLPWCDNTGRDMDDIYVSLELEEKRSMGSSKLVDNDDLFTLKSKGQVATRVLIKGVAGSGKSTLLAKLAYSWAQQKPGSPFSNYDLLFILSLREVYKDGSLVDAIFQQILPTDTNVSKDNLQMFIKKHPGNIIILLDGLDEYSHVAGRGKENDIDKMLQYEAFRDCQVIVSTRPHKLLSVKHQSYYVSVNLTGFSNENVDLYMSRFFHGNIEIAAKLKNRLQESDILTDLSTIPVMLMLICLLWKDEQKLPETQSELYQEFARYLWRKYCIKLGKQDEGEIFEQECEEGICSIGQKALEGLIPNCKLKEEKLIFSEKEFSPLQFKLGCETGLITRERLRSKLKMISSVTFLHKSFQEFCAAKYWASLLDTNFDLFHSTLKQLDTWDELSSKMELLKFCCGVDGKAGSSVIQHAIKLFQSTGEYIATGRSLCINAISSSKPLDNILSLLHESNMPFDIDDDAQANQHHGQVCRARNSAMLFHDQSQLPPEQPMFSIAKAVKSIFSSGMLKMYEDKRSLPIFHNFVKSSFGSSSLSTITSLECELFSAPSLQVVTDTMQCMPDVQEVVFESLIDEPSASEHDGMRLLGDKLGSLSKLNTIYFTSQGENMMPIGPLVHALSLSSYCTHYIRANFIRVTFDATDMVRLLSNAERLEILQLDHNEMTPSVVKSLLGAMSKQSELRMLKLVGNQVTEAIGHIGNIMTPNLKHLDLAETGLNEEHVTIFSESLHQATNLEELYLSDNNVGMSIVPLAQQLQYCIKLYELRLNDAHIPEQGIIELANRFAFMPNLVKLYITGNGVGNIGIHAVFKHIHYLKQLGNLQMDARIDHQCSDLVKDCLLSIDLPVLGTESRQVEIILHDYSRFQSVIRTASEYH